MSTSSRTSGTCPVCGQSCGAHDFQDKAWRYLNFFQHHCYIHGPSRKTCPAHAVTLVEMPWAPKGSAFTLLFEQPARVLSHRNTHTGMTDINLIGGPVSAVLTSTWFFEDPISLLKIHD